MKRLILTRSWTMLPRLFVCEMSRDLLYQYTIRELAVYLSVSSPAAGELMSSWQSETHLLMLFELSVGDFSPIRYF
jgi:hypothetical protein